MREDRLFADWRELNCMLPIYDENGGNSTTLVFNGGERILVTRRTDTLIRKLSNHFAWDLVRIRQKYGRLIGRKTAVPLPFHPELVLIPLKYRKPLFKDEGARGYFVRAKLDGCYELSSTRSLLCFTDGSEEEIQQSASGIKLAIAHADIVGNELKRSFAAESIIPDKEELYIAIHQALQSLRVQRT